MSMLSQALCVKMAVTYKENAQKTPYWLKIQTVHALSLVYMGRNEAMYKAHWG